MNLREAALLLAQECEAASPIPGGLYSEAAQMLRKQCAEIERMKEGDNLSPAFDRSADAGKTVDDTPEQRMLRKKWFGGRLYGHLPFLEAVDETMKSLHAELDEALGTWKMLDDGAGKTSDHIADADKMVEPVAWMHEWDGEMTLNTTPPKYYGNHWKHTPLYASAPKREPLTDEKILELLPHKQNYWTEAETGLWIARAIERAHGIGGEE